MFNGIRNAPSDKEYSEDSDDGGGGMEFYGEPDYHATEPKRRRRAT